MATRNVKRVVTGQKCLWITDPKTGVRVRAEPGDTVSVAPTTAEAFADRLIDPKVAAAQLAAQEAAEAAMAAVVEDDEEVVEEDEEVDED